VIFMILSSFELYTAKSAGASLRYG
jgi:hypothetical protein